MKDMMRIKSADILPGYDVDLGIPFIIQGLHGFVLCKLVRSNVREKAQDYFLEFYYYYGPKKLKFETISLLKEKFFKKEIREELNNKSFLYLSDFFKKINEIYKS